MTVFTVNDDVFKTVAAQEYFSRADSRVMVGVRAALELLGIPLPDYAVRKPPGRPPSRKLAAAYDADQGIAWKPAPIPPLSERRRAGQLRKAQTRVDDKRAAQGLGPRDWAEPADANNNLFNDIFTQD